MFNNDLLALLVVMALLFVIPRLLVVDTIINHPELSEQKVQAIVKMFVLPRIDIDLF